MVRPTAARPGAMTFSTGGAVRKLPIWPTVREALFSVFGNFRLFLGLGGVPMALTGFTFAWLFNILFRVVSQLQTTSVTSPAAGIAPDLDRIMGQILVPYLMTYAVQIVCCNAFAVRWLMAALDPDPHNWTGERFWGSFKKFLLYQAIFFMAGIALWLGTGFVGLIANTLQSAGFGSGPVQLAALLSLSAYLLLYAWILRCTLLFPAAVYGRKLGFREASHLLHGNTWRLVGSQLLAFILVYAGLVISFFVTAFVIELGVFIFSALAHWGVPAAAGAPGADQPLEANLAILLVAGFVVSAIFYLLLAVASSILAIFYREIVLRPVSHATNIVI